MKKTSIIFLGISLIIIIVGFILKGCGASSASLLGIDLFKQTITEEGNLVEVFEFSSDETNKVNIDISNVDINIIGGAEKSYAEIINLNSLEYSAFDNNRAFTINDDIVSSLIGRAEGGSFGFNGVRDFLRFEKHNDEKVINIYVADNSAVKIFDIKIDKGNITVDNIKSECDYVISINNGNFSCKNTTDISLVKTDIKNGNVNLDNVYMSNSEICIENGNVNLSTPKTTPNFYKVKCEVGTIYYNNDKHNGIYNFNIIDKKENVNINVGVGDVNIKTID